MTREVACICSIVNYIKDYCLNNREDIRTKQMQYYIANKPEIRKRHKNYYYNNKLLLKEHKDQLNINCIIN